MGAAGSLNDGKCNFTSSNKKGNKLTKNLIKQLDQVKIHFDKQCNAFYTSGRLLTKEWLIQEILGKLLEFVFQFVRSRTRTLYPNTFGLDLMEFLNNQSFETIELEAITIGYI